MDVKSMHMKDLSTATGSAESQRGGVIIHLSTPAYLYAAHHILVSLSKPFKLNSLYVNINMAGCKHK